MQTQSGQSVTGVDGADIGTTFRKMVDQMTQIPGSSVSTGSQTAQNMQQFTPHSPEQNYDRYQYQKNKMPEQSTKDWTAGSQVSEKLESFEESVRDVIKDELQVTDEQITEAMETLGLTVADLMNPQQLAALAAELTGTEDMSALLCNEAFMNVMQSVGTLTEDLLQQLVVTAEELTQLLEDAGQTDMDADLMQTVQTADAGETDVTDAQKVYADTADGIRDTAEQPQMAAQAAETETRTEEAKDITPEETDTQAKSANAGAEEETAADAAAGSDKEQAQTGSNSNSGQQNSASQAHVGVDVHTGPTLTETVAMQGANSAGEYAAQVDIADVVRQIVTYTRVNYTANQETTMEMQLNPEHLGKIYLEITSKDGTVSAHLTAQNEVVKEALESQIADLKQNMNQAGVKVDAVEVTVGGHEFERNLEQNAKQEEQQGQEARAAARNVVLQLEDACDQAAGRCADGSAHQHTGTHDQGTVESRLGNAAQCGNTEGSDHALAALILEVHGNSQCAAADCQVGDKAHRRNNQVVTDAGDAFHHDGGDGLIQAQHDQIGIDSRANRSCNNTCCAKECLKSIADHTAELGANGSEDDQRNGNDDQHGKQRL